METQLRAWRQTLGLSQAEVATLLRVSLSTIQRMETGSVTATQAGTLVRVAHGFGAAVTDLVPCFDLKPSRMNPILEGYLRELRRRPKHPSNVARGYQIAELRRNSPDSA